MKSKRAVKQVATVMLYPALYAALIAAIAVATGASTLKAARAGEIGPSCEHGEGIRKEYSTMLRSLIEDQKLYDEVDAELDRRIIEENQNAYAKNVGTKAALAVSGGILAGRAGYLLYQSSVAPKLAAWSAAAARAAAARSDTAIGGATTSVTIMSRQLSDVGRVVTQPQVSNTSLTGPLASVATTATVALIPDFGVDFQTGEGAEWQGKRYFGWNEHPQRSARTSRGSVEVKFESTAEEQLFTALYLNRLARADINPRDEYYRHFYGTFASSTVLALGNVAMHQWLVATLRKNAAAFSTYPMTTGWLDAATNCDFEGVDEKCCDSLPKLTRLRVARELVKSQSERNIAVFKSLVMARDFKMSDACRVYSPSGGKVVKHAKKSKKSKARNDHFTTAEHGESSDQGVAHFAKQAH